MGGGRLPGWRSAGLVTSLLVVLWLVVLLLAPGQDGDLARPVGQRPSAGETVGRDERTLDAPVAARPIAEVEADARQAAPSPSLAAETDRPPSPGVAAPRPAGQARVLHLEVHVLDDESDAGISGALVETFGIGGPQGSFRTDGSGTVRLELRDSARLALRVSADGYGTAARAIDPRRDLAEPCTVRLRGEAACEVTVTDGKGPRPGVRVGCELLAAETALWSNVVFSITDGHGEAEFRGRPEGMHRFFVALPRDEPFDFEHATVQISASSPLDPSARVFLPAGRRQRVTLEVPELASLAGSLSRDGASLHGALLLLVEDDGTRWFDGGTPSGWRAISDRSGTFSVGACPAGMYRLLIDHESLPMRVERALTLAPGPNECSVDLGGARLAGRVVDRAGAPIHGAHLRPRLDAEQPRRPRVIGAPERPPRAGARTDADGAFELEGLMTGERLAVEVSGPFVVGSVTKVEPLEEGETRRLDVVVARGGAIEVHVRTGNGPVTGAIARASRAEGEEARYSVTDEEGRCTFQGLPPGLWLIERIEGDGTGVLAPVADRVVDVEPDATGEVRFDP